MHSSLDMFLTKLNMEYLLEQIIKKYYANTGSTGINVIKKMLKVLL